VSVPAEHRGAPPLRRPSRRRPAAPSLLAVPSPPRRAGIDPLFTCCSLALPAAVVPEPYDPKEKDSTDVLGLLPEMALDRAAHDLSQCRQRLPFIKLRISDGNSQKPPIRPVEPNRRPHPGRAFEIGLDRLCVFRTFDQRADYPAPGKPERERKQSGKSECGQSGHVCSSRRWDANHSRATQAICGLQRTLRHRHAKRSPSPQPLPAFGDRELMCKAARNAVPSRLEKR
jgi:hypothetical protein